MKLPIGIIARWALNNIVVPAIGRAVASPGNPLTKDAAKRALEDAVQDAVLKRLGR